MKMKYLTLKKIKKVKIIQSTNKLSNVAMTKLRYNMNWLHHSIHDKYETRAKSILSLVIKEQFIITISGRFYVPTASIPASCAYQIYPQKELQISTDQILSWLNQPMSCNMKPSMM